MTVNSLQSIVMRMKVQRNKKLPPFAEYLTSVNSNDNSEIISGPFCDKCCLQNKCELFCCLYCAGKRNKQIKPKNFTVLPARKVEADI